MPLRELFVPAAVMLSFVPDILLQLPLRQAIIPNAGVCCVRGFDVALVVLLEFIFVYLLIG